MMNRRTILGVVTIAILAGFPGCDRAYRYLFFPPEQLEYTLVPDIDQTLTYNDSSYTISKDSLSIVFNRKTFKVEVKYLSDYQLNTYEFPDDSKDFEFSANPFTYANWIDPQIGYTPNRFGVFKISIFNYTASKLNFDPEKAVMVTDRGDLLPGYGREEKTSRNQSLEAYFKRRKGASGVEDEIFERRMGIVRTAVLYFGRPVYAGDSREGLLVFDPLNESVEQTKLVLNDFITGYDENNEPNEFATLKFYFKRTLLVKEQIRPSLARMDTTKAKNAQEAPLPKVFEVHLIRYNIAGRDDGEQQWNSKPHALPMLVRFVTDSLSVSPILKTSLGESPDLANATIAFLLPGPSEPLLSEKEISNLATMIRQGGFLFIDNSAFSSSYQYFVIMSQVLHSIGSKLDRLATVSEVPNDHEFYRAWRKLPGAPQGMDDVENMPEKRTTLEGLFWRGRLVAVVSTKGYSMMWEEGDLKRLPQFTLGANAIVYAARAAR